MSDVPFVDKITFRYIVPEHIQDSFISGVYGGINPKNMIWANLFTEAQPMPDEETYKIKDGIFVDQLNPDRVVRGDIVRKVQSSLVMDIETAITFRDWLTLRIAEAQNNIEKIQK